MTGPTLLAASPEGTMVDQAADQRLVMMNDASNSCYPSPRFPSPESPYRPFYSTFKVP